MKGFTLIELLVVVIIIGILSAIALPQYELVVEKSRAAEAMINAKAIRDAIERHLQEFPDDPVKTISQIEDVKIKSPVYGNVYRSKNFRYILDNNSFRVERIDGDWQQIGQLYQITYSYNTANGTWTVTSSCDDDYEQVCKLFTDL